MASYDCLRRNHQTQCTAGCTCACGPQYSALPIITSKLLLIINYWLQLLLEPLTSISAYVFMHKHCKLLCTCMLPGHTCSRTSCKLVPLGPPNISPPLVGPASH